MDTRKQRLDALSAAKRRLGELRRRKAASKEASIHRLAYKGELPLSFAQQRQWLLHQFAPNSPAYNAPEVLRLRGRLDVQVLERAVNEIVRRHEVLRTTYHLFGVQPVQLIQPALQISLGLRDVRHLPPEHREIAAKRMARDEIHERLDLARGPVLRALLVQLGVDDHLLVVTFHHIAYDGWSKTIFNRELAGIYDRFSEGRPSGLPELPIQYADYAVWQRNHMQGEVLEKHLEFWRSQLSGAPRSLALPTDHAYPETANFSGAQEHVLVPPNVVDELRSISKQHGATLFMTLLSLLDILWAQWTGQRDLVIGTVVANRDRVETENLIGCFINFLPLRSTIGERDTALDVLRQTRAAVLASYAHQDCPFEKIVEGVKAPRAASATPIYNVVFLFQNYPATIFDSRKLEAQAVPVEREAAHMDLRIAASETSQALRLDCDYRRELFNGDTVKALLRSYCSLAEQLVSNPCLPVSRFRLGGELQAQAAQGHGRSRKTIVITSTFTADSVEEPLRFWMNELEVPCEMHFAPFNQVFQGLLDRHSELSRNRSGLNVVLVRFEDWQEDQAQDAEAFRLTVERNAEDLITALGRAATRSAVPYLLCLCPAWQETPAGAGGREFLDNIEQKIATTLRSDNTIYVVTSAELAALYPMANYEDRHAWELARVPYTRDFFTALGTMIARRFYRIHAPRHKVLVLDCDNTLWRGICGEDGPAGVLVDEPCRALQRFVLDQRQAGMLIALCSKNNETDVWNVFEQNPGMVLRREHITGCRINWRTKSENLRSLADELRLALDSFILLDDNPMECAEVEAGCPEVLTLRLPENKAELGAFLEHVWAFDHLQVTSEDGLRNEFYAWNAERAQLEKRSISLDDFLASLKLEVEIGPMEKSDLARVSQLTERTNQFNFTTLRRTEPEIQQLCADGAECAVVSVRDRFGDYGLVGAMIFRPKASVLELDTLLLSCRALGRRVEHRMLAYLGQMAMTRRKKQVRIRFRPTSKNQPAREFLDSIGAVFEREAEGDFLSWPTVPERLATLGQDEA